MLHQFPRDSYNRSLKFRISIYVCISMYYKIFTRERTRDFKKYLCT